MNNFSSHPWYCTEGTLATEIRDRDGRIIARLSPDINEERERATARLMVMAPSLLISLRFAIGLLRRAGDHEDLCRHLQRVVARVEPEDVAVPAEEERELAECA